MSALSLKSAKLSSVCVKNHAVLFTALRNHWNKDFKPAPIPKTEEERIAAAKKYNLHPSEYKTYPDDGTGVGDYPKLPLISSEAKDPFYPYDYPEQRRNYGEPLHVEFDLISEDRFDLTTRPRFPMSVIWARFLGVMSGCFIVYYLCEYVKIFPGTAIKQYPASGKVHYTFEPKQ